MSEPGRFFIATMRVVPKKALSKTIRRLAGVRSQMAVRRFAARFEVAVEEAEHPLEAYESVLALFTRKLKPGIRPIDPDPRALVSPVDGAVLVADAVGEGQLFQAKGRAFTLGALLAEDGAEVRCKDGAYATIYLSPKDYHRIHAPVGGRITGSTYVPGELFPVNPAAVAHVDELFAKNERLITHIQSDTLGRVDVVKVGATNVGHITVPYDETIATNVGGKEIVRKTYDPPIPIAKGDEVGVFEMGSTVIVVSERRVELEPLAAKDVVRLGQRIGTFVG